MKPRPTREELEQRIQQLEKEREESRKSQQLLLDRGQLFEILQRQARIGGWEWDLESDSMHWTDETYRIHDLNPEDFTPGSPELIEASLACYHPEDREHIFAAFQRCQNEGVPYDLEFPLTTAGGEHIWVRSTAQPIMDGERICKVVGTLMDITEIRQASTRATESQELLANLAKLVPGVIYQYRLYPDGSSAFPYSSPGMVDIYGVTPEEVREDATPVFGRLHPDDANAVAEAIFDSARTLDTFFSEFRVNLPDKGVRWRWSQAQPERLPDGGTLWHGIITDITELKNAEAEKDKLQDQLFQSQKMESVGRLAGGVAHDFNNMLSVIQGYTELAAEKLPGGSPAAKDLEIVLNATRRSTDITRQLLAYSRQQTIAPRLLDLNKTVDGMLKMLRRLIGEDIDLVWAPGTHIGAVKIDPIQLDQVLLNLCANSRDAIGNVGNITIETTTRTFDEEYCRHHAGFQPGKFVQLAVSDNGCGMDKATRDQVFEPFFTTKELGKGTGMGLATVFGIVKQNDGFINVYSEPGQGTTFRIYLPFHGEPEQEEGLPAEEIPMAQGQETLLVVEDELYILNLAGEMLENLGYKVHKAQKPGEALQLALRDDLKLDLLVTDVVLPDMNGRELATRIQNALPHTKVLFMSGYTADVIANRGILHEGVHFVHKPFSKQELATEVRRALDHHPGRG